MTMQLTVIVASSAIRRLPATMNTTTKAIGKQMAKPRKTPSTSFVCDDGM